MAITTASERLSRRTKLLYGVGDTGFSLTSTLIGAYFLLFLTDVVGLRPALAGLAITGAENPMTPRLGANLGARIYKRWQIYRIDV